MMKYHDGLSTGRIVVGLAAATVIVVLAFIGLAAIGVGIANAQQPSVVNQAHDAKVRRDLSRGHIISEAKKANANAAAANSVPALRVEVQRLALLVEQLAQE